MRHPFGLIFVSLAALAGALASSGAQALTIESVGENPFSNVPFTGGTGNFRCESAGNCSISKDFTSIGSIPIVIGPIDGIPSSGIDILSISENITNDTGLDWADFHLAFIPIDNGPMTIDFQNVTNSGEFTSFTATSDALSLFGSVPNGDVFSLSFDLKITGDQGAYNLFAVSEEPSVPSIPEPATIALIGVALAGLGCSRRRGNARRATRSSVESPPQEVPSNMLRRC